MGAGNEAVVSWNDVVWWITACTTSLESRALLWERQTAHSVVTESLNFKHSASSSFCTFTQTFIYSGFFFFFSDRLDLQPSTCCVYFLCLSKAEMFFAEMKFSKLGVSCYCHILIMNVIWGAVHWIMIKNQQLRCDYLHIPTSLDMDAGYFSLYYLWYF